MNGHDAILLGLANIDIGTSIGANCDGLAGAAGAALRARDDIAVGAGGEASLQRAVQIVVVIVEGDEALAATAEGDLVAAIVPPILEPRITDDIAEANHVIDLAPAMLAHPAAAARVVAIEGRRGNVVAIGSGWSLIGVVEREGGHHTRCAERMGQHESGGHFVLLGHLVGQHVSATSAMSTLVVVIVHKDKRSIRIGKAPGSAPVAQIAQLILATEHLTNGIRMTEFSDSAHASIFRLGDGLVAQIDDLLEDIGSGARGEAMSSVQVVQAPIDDTQVSRPHVLGSIHTETGNTQVRQMVQEVNDLVAHPGIALVQVAQTDQLAVAHVCGVSIVGDRAGGIEVQRGERHTREALGAGIG